MIEEFDTILTIDCGVNGAVVVQFPDKSIIIEKLAVSFEDLSKQFESYSGVAFVEHQHLRKSDCVSGRWHNIHKLCMHYQRIKDSLECNGLKVVEVTPQEWQIQFFLQSKNYLDRKKELKLKATKEFPDVKVTGWNQDALLMNKYINDKYLRNGKCRR